MSIRSTNGDLTNRALSTGVPGCISKPFVELFLKWKRCSGEEWTVQRLKSIKLDFIRLKAGLEPVSKWVGVNHRTGRFSGIIGQLQKFSGQKPGNFAKSIQLIQIFTSLVSSTITVEQSNKFLSGVKAEPPGIGKEIGFKYVSKGCYFSNLLPLSGTLHPAATLLDMKVSPSRRGPTLVGSRPEEESLIDSALYLLDTKHGYEHYLKYLDLYRPVLRDILPYDVLRTSMRAPSRDLGGLLVGRVGLIQEPGYKLRAVANPGRVFQRVLEPLGDSIYSLLRTLPWDCTFSQEKALPYLQKALADGRTVSSIDLSGATDYFPLDLQIDVLQWLFKHHPLVDLFEDVSKAEWLMPGFGNICWKRGQPLGLYPSFGSFALTHGLLLLGIVGEKYSNQFFVLGDDVVILDTKIADEYMRVLSILGCPFSDTKTIRSNKLCEFAGKIVTPNEVIPQLKWRACSDDSFVDVVRLLGPRSLGLLQLHQRRVISEISEVPEIYGGLGWNPKGKPLEDRLKAPWILDEEYKAQSRATGLSRERISKLMKSSLVQSGIKNLASRGCDIQYLLPEDDLEQRSFSLTSSHIPRLWPWHMVMGKNLDLVFQSLTQTLDLPIKSEMGSSRPSTLQVWMKRLGLQLGKNC